MNVLPKNGGEFRELKSWLFILLCIGILLHPIVFLLFILMCYAWWYFSVVIGRPTNVFMPPDWQ